MKWKAPRRTEHGDIRIVRKFALFPVQLDLDTVIWLERYWEKQRFDSGPEDWFEVGMSQDRDDFVE